MHGTSYDLYSSSLIRKLRGHFSSEVAHNKNVVYRKGDILPKFRSSIGLPIPDMNSRHLSRTGVPWSKFIDHLHGFTLQSNNSGFLVFISYDLADQNISVSTHFVGEFKANIATDDQFVRSYTQEQIPDIETVLYQERPCSARSLIFPAHQRSKGSWNVPYLAVCIKPNSRIAEDPRVRQAVKN